MAMKYEQRTDGDSPQPIYYCNLNIILQRYFGTAYMFPYSCWLTKTVILVKPCFYKPCFYKPILQYRFLNKLLTSVPFQRSLMAYPNKVIDHPRIQRCQVLGHFPI